MSLYLKDPIVLVLRVKITCFRAESSGSNTYGLLTWRWGTPGTLGNLLRWGKKLNHVFWRLILFYTPLLLLLQPSVLWLSIVTFNNDAKSPPKLILREFDVSRIGPLLGGLPHLERLHGKI